MKLLILIAILTSQTALAEGFFGDNDIKHPYQNTEMPTVYCPSTGQYTNPGWCPQMPRQQTQCTTRWDGIQYITLCQ